jgi:hypothetical protein
MSAAAGEAAAAMPWSATSGRRASAEFSAEPPTSDLSGPNTSGYPNTSGSGRRPRTAAGGGAASLYDIDERDYIVHELLLQSALLPRYALINTAVPRQGLLAACEHISLFCIASQGPSLHRGLH